MAGFPEDLVYYNQRAALGLIGAAIIFGPAPILLRLVEFFPGNESPWLLPILMVHGLIEVSLVVSDGMSFSDPSVTTATITEPVMNLAPVANPGGPYTGEPGQAIMFDGSNSADPNGDALTYSWDFGDGAMGQGVSPSHTYAADGQYTVTLVVNDGEFDSTPAISGVEIVTPVVQSDGEVLYNTHCLACHGDPWDEPAVDSALAGLRRVAGSRSCNIEGSIFGTSVFPNGVPEMQYLQGLGAAELAAMADYLNSKQTTGEQRYVSTCAGLIAAGLWLQWDYGDGPKVAGVRTHLFCAWLAWSRFRVILPLGDKTLPSVISAFRFMLSVIVRTMRPATVASGSSSKMPETVRKMNFCPGLTFFTSRKRSMPSISGMRTSERMRSKAFSRARERATDPSAATVMSKRPPRRAASSARSCPSRSNWKMAAASCMSRTRVFVWRPASMRYGSRSWAHARDWFRS